MPKFAALAMLFAMANCGLPGTAGFVGEWMVILGAVKANFWLGLAAATALIFGAAYTLWMYKRVYLGAPGNDHVKELSDIDAREFLMLALLAIFLQSPPSGVVFFGVLGQVVWLLLRVTGAAMLLSIGVAFRNQVSR